MKGNHGSYRVLIHGASVLGGVPVRILFRAMLLACLSVKRGASEELPWLQADETPRGA